MKLLSIAEQLKRSEFVDKIAGIEDEDIKKFYLDVYSDAINILNEKGGTVYKQGKNWSLQQSNMKGQVSPGSVDVEKSLALFVKHPDKDIVILLGEPKNEIQEQETNDKEIIRRNRAIKIIDTHILNTTKFKKYFNSNYKVAAQYIRNHGLTTYWFTVHAPNYRHHYSYNHNSTESIITIHLGFMINESDSNDRFEYLNKYQETWVSIIGMQLYQGMMENHLGINNVIEYLKIRGLYDIIVENEYHDGTNLQYIITHSLAVEGKLDHETLISYYCDDEVMYRDNFNSSKEYVEFLEEKGLLSYCYDNITSLPSAIQRIIFQYCITTEKYDFAIKTVLQVTNDLQIMDNKLYLVMDSLEELEDLFRRDDGPTAIKILTGDGYDVFNFYDLHTDMSDIIRNLDNKAMAVLRETILKHHKDEEISPTGLDDYITNEEEGTFNLTPVILDEIIADDNLVELIDEHLDDIKSALDSCYDSAYQSAYENECYKLAKSTVEDFFGAEPEEFDTGKKKQSKHDPKKYYTVYKWRIPLDRSVVLDNVIEYLDHNDLDYCGSYICMLKEADKQMDGIYWPDYPSDVDENLNSEVIEMLEERMM